VNVKSKTQTLSLKAKEPIMSPKTWSDIRINYKFSMSQAAAILSARLDIQIGRNQLCALLREKGIFDGNNLPVYKYQVKGYFYIEWNNTTYSGRSVVPTPRVLAKGLNLIQDLLEDEYGYKC
jgi:hypothetical protein